MIVLYYGCLAVVTAAITIVLRQDSRLPSKKYTLSPASVAAGVLLASIVFPSLYVVNVQTPEVWLPLAAGIGFLLGYLLVRGPSDAAILPRPTMLDRRGQHRYRRLLMIGTCILTALSILRYGGVPPILEVIYRLFGGADPRELLSVSSEARYELTKSAWFAGPDNQFNTTLIPIVRTGWPFLACVALAGTAFTPDGRGRRPFFGWFAVVSGMGMVFIAGDFVRDRILWAVITVLACAMMLRPRKGIVLIVAAALLGSLLIGLTLVSYKSAGGLKEQTIGRLDDNFSNDVVVYRFIDDGLLDFTYGGEHVIQLATVLPGVRVGTPFAYRVSQLNGDESSSTTFATGTNVSLTYVDWGFPGVAISFLVIGCLSVWIRRTLWPRESDPLHVACVASTTVAVGQGPIIGLIGILVYGLLAAGLYWLGRCLLPRPPTQDGSALPGDAAGGHRRTSRAIRGRALQGGKA